MSAMVHRDNGKTTEVRNLGWLIRHASECSRLVWVEHRHTKSDYATNTLHAFGPGWHYVTPFADRGVFKDWIARSHTLRHVPGEVVITCSLRELADVNSSLYGD